MESLEVLGAIVLTVGLIFGVPASLLTVRDYFVWRPMRKRWISLARQHGLEFRGRFVLASWSIQGRFQEVPVRATCRGWFQRLRHAARGVMRLKLRESLPETITLLEAEAPPGISLRRVGFGGLPPRRTDATGDPAFDSRVAADGAPLRLLPVLNTATRHIIANAVSRLVVEDGVVTLRSEKPLDAFDLERLLSELAFVARKLTPPSDPDARLERLADLVENDSVPRVQMQAIRLLATHGIGSTARANALASAQTSPDPNVRAECMIAAGADSSALRTVLGEVDPDVEIRVLDAIGFAPPGDFESLLLERLGKGDASVTIAVVGWLKKIGTRRAVEPLRAAEPTLAIGELSRAIHDAIAAIQSRLGDVDAGGLALADPGAAGALSEPAGAGTLALTRDRVKT